MLSSAHQRAHSTVLIQISFQDAHDLLTRFTQRLDKDELGYGTRSTKVTTNCNPITSAMKKASSNVRGLKLSPQGDIEKAMTNASEQSYKSYQYLTYRCCRRTLSVSASGTISVAGI